MVKRTVVVLGILSVIVLAAVPAMAQLIAANNWNSPVNDCFGGFLAPRTLMLPVDCPDPIPRTIQKTWECKIEGPCPAPAMGGGAMFGPKSDDRLGWLTATCMALGTPLDFIFGGCDGVYGCVEFSDGPCGSVCGGPVATVLRSLSYTFYPTEGSFFGGLW